MQRDGADCHSKRHSKQVSSTKLLVRARPSLYTVRLSRTKMGKQLKLVKTNLFKKYSVEKTDVEVIQEAVDLKYKREDVQA